MSVAAPAAGARARAGPDGPLLAVLAGAALLFFTGLGQTTLWDQDEAKYTQVAREILQTGDPITLHVNAVPWFVHPPLYMWLQAAGGAVLGFSEFTARMWSAVFGVIGVYATFLLGRLLFGRRAGLLAAVVLASTFQYFAQSRLAVFDGMLVAFMLLAFYAFLRALDGKRRFAWWAGIWAGLGTVTKGPIALLLPALVAGAYLLLRRPGRMRWREWVGPAVLYAAIAIPWYAIEWARHGWPFVQTVLGYYTVNRFLGVVEGQAGPWWYYAPVFGLGAFPWTAFLLTAVGYHAVRRQEAGNLLILLWCGITVAFYTLAGTKLPNYVLPVYPFAALGIAVTWDRAFDGDRLARRMLGLAAAFTVVGLLLFAAEIAVFARTTYPVAFAALQRHLILVAAALGVWLVIAVLLYAVGRAALSFGAVAATIALLAGTLVARTFPLIEEQRPTKAVAAAIRTALADDALLVGFRFSDHQTLIYYTDHPVRWVDDLSELVNVFCTRERLVLATTSAQWRWWTRVAPVYVPLRTTLLLERGDQVAAELRRTGPCRAPSIGR